MPSLLEIRIEVGNERRDAQRAPSVLFPAPGRPTRIRCGEFGSAAEAGCDVRKVAIEIPLNLRQ